MTDDPIQELIDNAAYWNTMPGTERKRIRENAGVSLREAAVALGVSHTAVRLWENGRMPHQETRDSYRRLLAGLQAITDQ